MMVISEQDIKDFYVYDIETYPNMFCVSFLNGISRKIWSFEISERKDESANLRKFLANIYSEKKTMVGFNNIGFDYPVIHYFLKNRGCTYSELYDYSMEVINAGEFEKFKYIVPDYKHIIRQVDLFKINHFDNKAKRTSLKMIEFNRLSDNIEDLPYLGINLTPEQMDEVLVYNRHDVKETYGFLMDNVEGIILRSDLTEKYGIDFTNFNDTKIGKDYFIMRLSEEDPDACYVVDDKSGRKKPRQTKRKQIELKDVIFPYIEFERPEFKAVKDWFERQVITETKGVFTEIQEHDLGDLAKYATMVEKKEKLKLEPIDKTTPEMVELLAPTKLRGKKRPPAEELDLIWEKVIDMKRPSAETLEYLKSVKPCSWVDEVRLKSGKDNVSFVWTWRIAEVLNTVVNGFQYDFGVGGIHGSISGKTVYEDDEYEIIDADVSSYYPNLFIKNRLHPQHLGELFCDIYQDVYEQRKCFSKKQPENKMMKLALNGTYGATNDKHSPFYDPKVTMAITINGQLLLCMLAEKLIKHCDAELIAINTDGLTVKIKRSFRAEYDKVCEDWMKLTKLELEFVNYVMYAARDVNNYVATYKDKDGKLNKKCKGTYVYDRKDLGHHQDQSALIIKEAAVQKIVYGKDIENTIKSCKNKYDFLLRTKVPRSSRLVSVDAVGRETKEQNICRYYVSQKGKSLVKIMPPLTEDGEERKIGIAVGSLVKTCNNINDFSWDIDYDYYISEAKKLADGVG